MLPRPAFYKITKKHDKIVKRLLVEVGLAPAPSDVHLRSNPGSAGAAAANHPGTPGSVAGAGAGVGVGGVDARAGVSLPGSVPDLATGLLPSARGRGGGAASLTTNLMNKFMASLENQPFLRILNNEKSVLCVCVARGAWLVARGVRGVGCARGMCADTR